MRNQNPISAHRAAESQMSERWEEAMQAANDPEGHSSYCCRFINPDVQMCRHPGKSDGVMGCIAFILGQMLVQDHYCIEDEAENLIPHPREKLK
jgi:hypothetical protein